ncbi:MAG: hypothetical protein ACRD2C_23165 [Acidimicrobiales bacterium]
MTTATPQQGTRDLLVPLAAHGLAGSTSDLPNVEFAPDEWFAIVRTCQARGLLGMLAAASQREQIQLTSTQAEELAVLENEAAGIALLVEQRVVRLSALLAAGGVAHRLVGAPPRARLGYRQPGIRMFEGATVLVEPSDLDIGVAWGVRVEPSVPLTDGRSIEVAHLSHPPTLLALADRVVPTVNIDEHLVLACLDLAAIARSGDGRGGPVDAADVSDAHPLALVLQRDVAELALSKEIDPVRAQSLAETWGVVHQVARALVQVWELFGLADRTRLSVWAHRIADAPVPVQRSMGSSAVARTTPAQRPSGMVKRVVRKVRKLAPSKVAARAVARRSSR